MWWEFWITNRWASIVLSLIPIFSFAFWLTFPSYWWNTEHQSFWLFLVKRESCSAVSNSLLPQGLKPYRTLCPWNSPGKKTGVGSHSLLQGIFPTPGIKRRSPTLQVDSLPSEPPGKPKNTGVGSLSLLQGIFPSQKLNCGLLTSSQLGLYHRNL